MRKIKSGIANYLLAPFSWSKWADIMTFTFGSTPYLLQGKVNSLSNAKRFRVTPIKNRTGIACPNVPTMEKLSSHGLIDTQVKHPTP